MKFVYMFLFFAILKNSLARSGSLKGCNKTLTGLSKNETKETIKSNLTSAKKKSVKKMSKGKMSKGRVDMNISC